MILAFFLSMPFWVAYLTENERKEGHWLNELSNYLGVVFDSKTEILVIFAPSFFIFGLHMLIDAINDISKLEAAFMFLGFGSFILIVDWKVYMDACRCCKFIKVTVAYTLISILLLIANIIVGLLGDTWVTLIQLPLSFAFGVYLLVTKALYYAEKEGDG